MNKTTGRRRLQRCCRAAIAGIIGLFCLTAYADDNGRHDGAGFEIAPINSRPEGRTYREWAVRWWQWALETPGSRNAIFDTAACDAAQRGSVWFIGGSIFGTGPIVRSCVLPYGKSLFFPIINSGYFAFPDDPPAQRTETYVREQAKCAIGDIEVKIDGTTVRNPKQYFERSPLFKVRLPRDNQLGLDPMLLSPSVDEGYYLFLEPLRAGTHSINWRATCGGYKQDVHYTLIVRRDRDD